MYTLFKLVNKGHRYRISSSSSSRMSTRNLCYYDGVLVSFIILLGNIFRNWKHVAMANTYQQVLIKMHLNTKCLKKAFA